MKADTPKANQCGTGGVSISIQDQTTNSRMSVDEIAKRLSIGRLAVYSMLEQGIIPGIRLGRRWIVNRYAYEQWERSYGMRPSSRLEIGAAKEVRVC